MIEMVIFGWGLGMLTTIFCLQLHVWHKRSLLGKKIIEKLINGLWALLIVAILVSFVVGFWQIMTWMF